MSMLAVSRVSIIVKPRRGWWHAAAVGVYQQTTSGLSITNQACYERNSDCFSIFGFEYKPGCVWFSCSWFFTGPIGFWSLDLMMPTFLGSTTGTLHGQFIRLVLDQTHSRRLDHGQSRLNLWYSCYFLRCSYQLNWSYYILLVHHCQFGFLNELRWYRLWQDQTSREDDRRLDTSISASKRKEHWVWS